MDFRPFGPAQDGAQCLGSSRLELAPSDVRWYWFVPRGRPTLILFLPSFSEFYRIIRKMFRRSVLLVDNRAYFFSHPSSSLVDSLICMHRFSQSSEGTTFTAAFGYGVSFSYAIIVSGRSGPFATSIFLGRVTAFFEKLVTRTWNCTYSRTSYIPRAGSTLCFCLSICRCLMVTNPFGEIIIMTGDSVSAETVTCFAIWIVACSCSSRLDSLSDRMLDISDRSLLCPKLESVQNVWAWSFRP